tara:strand:- start:554 stop:781 length:228 start_codon:yes stop_codon:yes gene_type:complete
MEKRYVVYHNDTFIMETDNEDTYRTEALNAVRDFPNESIKVVDTENESIIWGRKDATVAVEGGDMTTTTEHLNDR